MTLYWGWNFLPDLAMSTSSGAGVKRSPWMSLRAVSQIDEKWFISKHPTATPPGGLLQRCSRTAAG